MWNWRGGGGTRERVAFGAGHAGAVRVGVVAGATWRVLDASQQWVQATRAAER